MGFTKLMTWSLNLLNFGWSNDSLQLSPQQVVRQTHLHRCPLPVADNTIWVADYRSLFYPSRVDITKHWMKTDTFLVQCMLTDTYCQKPETLVHTKSSRSVQALTHPLFWISLDVHPSKYTRAGTKPGAEEKNSSVFPFFFIQPVGKYGKMTHSNSPCLHSCIAREVVLLLFTDLLFNILHHIRSEAYSPLGCQ